jgi:hypothetical protein
MSRRKKLKASSGIKELKDTSTINWKECFFEINQLIFPVWDCFEINSLLLLSGVALSWKARIWPFQCVHARSTKSKEKYIPRMTISQVVSKTSEILQESSSLQATSHKKLYWIKRTTLTFGAPFLSPTLSSWIVLFGFSSNLQHVRFGSKLLITPALLNVLGTQRGKQLKSIHFTNQCIISGLKLLSSLQQFPNLVELYFGSIKMDRLFQPIDISSLTSALKHLQNLFWGNNTSNFVSSFNEICPLHILKCETRITATLNNYINRLYEFDLDVRSQLIRSNLTHLALANQRCLGIVLQWLTPVFFPALLSLGLQLHAVTPLIIGLIAQLPSLRTLTLVGVNEVKLATNETLDPKEYNKLNFPSLTDVNLFSVKFPGQMVPFLTSTGMSANLQHFEFSTHSYFLPYLGGILNQEDFPKLSTLKCFHSSSTYRCLIGDAVLRRFPTMFHYVSSTLSFWPPKEFISFL